MTKSLVFNIHSEIECSICLKCKIFLNVCFWFFICISAAVAVVNFMFFNNIGFLDCIILLILIFYRRRGGIKILLWWFGPKNMFEKDRLGPRFQIVASPSYLNTSLGLSSYFDCMLINRQEGNFIINLFLRSNRLAIPYF